MDSVFDKLPGVEMPVDDVLKKVAEMWSPDPTNSSRYGVNRASQLNLVLHFGQETTLQEAEERFQAAVDFAQRYPCRLVVLCSYVGEPSDEVSTLFRSKLYSVCYIGDNLREQCCCEALILTYPRAFPKYLESQLTLWVEADLPIYHWFVKVPADRISENYLGFASKCRRVIYDSDIENDDLSKIDWPRPKMAHDLASARLLSVRQSIGQLLSSYQADTVLDGLSGISLTYRSGMKGEAHHLMSWLQKCSKLSPDLMSAEEVVGTDERCISVAFDYPDDRAFTWCFSSETGEGQAKGKFSNTEFCHHLRIKKPNTNDTLSEALFFNS